MTMNAVLMTVTGFFIGGVANLISAAISADLGNDLFYCCGSAKFNFTHLSSHI
jgi:hypothetical protein